MKRLIGVVLALVLGAGLASTALAASTTLPHSGRVLMAVGGDIVVPAGEQADAVIVINGNAQVLGRVSSVVVVDGSATISGTTRRERLMVMGRRYGRRGMPSIGTTTHLQMGRCLSFSRAARPAGRRRR